MKVNIFLNQQALENKRIKWLRNLLFQKGKCILPFSIILLLIGFVGNAQNCDLSYTKGIKKIVLNDSLTIAYKETGAGKETFLMIHGLGGNLTHWSNNFLEKKHCIAFDLPTYGLSTMKNFQVQKAHQLKIKVQ